MEDCDKTEGEGVPVDDAQPVDFKNKNVSEIHCADHPDRPAVARCVQCGRTLCEACRNQNELGLSVCSECASRPQSAVSESQNETEAEVEGEPQDPKEGIRGDSLPPKSAQVLLQRLLLEQAARQEWRKNCIEWENPTPRSDGAAFLKTCLAAFLTPMQFMSRVPWVRRDLRSPLCFALLCGSVGQMAVTLQALRGSDWLQMAGGYPAELSRSMVLLSLCVAPLMLCVKLILESGLAHFCLRASGMTKRPFESTFRAFAYAQVSWMAMLLPAIGGFVQSFFLIFLILNGIRNAHRAGLSAGLLALLPMVLLEGFAQTFLQHFMLT